MNAVVGRVKQDLTANGKRHMNKRLRQLRSALRTLLSLALLIGIGFGTATELAAAGQGSSETVFQAIDFEAVTGSCNLAVSAQEVQFHERFSSRQTRQPPTAAVAVAPIGRQEVPS